MLYRMFAAHGFTDGGAVLPLERFVPFCDRGTEESCGFRIHPDYAARLIREAEALLGKEYSILKASEYMDYKRNGNRSVYEKKYFERRNDLLTLTVAEYCEGRGRFSDALVNLIWMLLEESTWVVPAHHPSEEGDEGRLPYAVGGEYADEVNFIDLFSATTGACLAFTLYLLEKPLYAVSRPLVRRLRFELERRIVRPFINRKNHGIMWWTGVSGGTVNNWGPWIVSNVLTVCALTEPSLTVRQETVTIALEVLDRFTSFYEEDGACDEGPSYWSHAGGALFAACEVLYDMTGGVINVYSDDLLRRMGEYRTGVTLVGMTSYAYADTPVKQQKDSYGLWPYEWGLRCGSSLMCEFWQNRLNGQPLAQLIDSFAPYRQFHALSIATLPPLPGYRPERFTWFPDRQLAVSREADADGRVLPETQGLVLAIKGGHNDESHNHNDVGSFCIYADGRPLLVDAGRGSVYTGRSFSEMRYSLWHCNSGYHNVALINGACQPAGRDYGATVVRYDRTTGALTLDLTAAYPHEAGLKQYIRRSVLEDGKITVEDTVTLRTDAAGTTVALVLMCLEEPQAVTAQSFVLNGRTVRFDPRLQFTVERVPCDSEETADIPALWEAESVWRILLTDAAVPRDTAMTYTTVIE